MRSSLPVAWYRFRATFRRRRSGYLAIVLLVGLVGGLAMASIAAARRTQSSFPTYVASTHPSELQAFDGYVDPAIGYKVGYSPALARTIAHLPHVRVAKSVIGFDANLVPLSGVHIHQQPGEKPPVFEGSTDGEFVEQDRVTLVEGHLANPNRRDQVVMNAQAARELGLHIGSTARIGFNSDAQILTPSCCSLKADPPKVVVDLRLVGIVVFPQTVVQDGIDALGSQDAIFSQALTREAAQCCASYSSIALQVNGGARAVAAVKSKVDRLVGKGLAAAGADVGGGGPSLAVSTAERAIRPEAIALGVFGGIAALAALLIALQVIGRQLRLGADELGALRALGAGPVMTVADGLIGILGAVSVGSFLAVAVAVGLSPLSPVGPVRPVYPTPGVSFDWTVLGLGLLVLAVGLGALSVGLAYRATPHRVAGRRGTVERTSSVARAAASSGLPTPAVAGIRFALEPGSGRNAVPVRSAILGAVLAITVVIATFSFGSSLDGLVSRPALYGWNWNYMELSGFSGDQDLPNHQTATLLSHDRYVSGFIGVYFDSLRIDGQTVPVLGASPGASVQPALLSGHGFDKSNQVVLGATTLAELHKHVGDTVTVSNGVTKPTRLTVVGTATMPAVGTQKQHLEMGTGALLAYQLIPATARNLQGSPVLGPNAFFIRIRGGVNPTLALRSLQRINKTLNASPDNSGGLVGVLRPAEIANYRSIGTIPALLGGALAIGAVVALGLTLVASVRRRRRDLALLKTLGFTQLQVAATVSWQSTVAVGIGTVVGVPLGIVVGRTLWDLFARNIHAVPAPSVPVLTVVLIALGALVLANIVAAIPGRIAARTPTALILRAE
jgi:ABC-type antimicrobial peptide transport system permease subunit